MSNSNTAIVRGNTSTANAGPGNNYHVRVVGNNKTASKP